MAATSFRVDVPAGSVLFHQGDAPTSAFLLESGSIEVITVHGDVSRRLGVLGPGDLLGEMAVLDDSPRSATARALADCVLMPIDRKQFAERLDSADPVVRALLLSQISRYRSALAQMSGQIEPSAASLPVPRSSDASVALDKIRLEGHLREALDKGELEVRLQPILDIAHHRIAGFEALTRWTHPERGPISPAEFIALAEETSLIVPVGDYVLDQVCSALQQLAPGDAADPLFVALNVSGRQLADPALLDRFLAVIRAHGLQPAQLKIEITESLVLDYVQVSRIIERCHAAGIKVALDDFGTGYSNLGHLHKLEFDTLKLDQGFVRQMHEPRCLAIVHAVVVMAHSLGCNIVAEGVETQAQLDSLRELGCTYAQGYLIGKPLALVDAVALATSAAA
ncbi:EAL domain-containing protein (putative c-di-GMP-specific phosphodiesterase class I) [Tahibacter aquaticus]|uniref:EAL domain-containing protein (Putative c-di-GMP-specific phosphodiesterase class I) n=1 Tax=Tahibacter aquaticus TaxID=520092 RepID=A0A4V3DM15_9GAMM|nr:EAL domain-containing protein [Tahibacter aquaticus]TDR41702.1 EAL domain-containing protein (putative c-di-GMP-specific phosphodiesterase class I) [Tahibacter aquaticus]